MTVLSGREETQFIASERLKWKDNWISNYILGSYFVRDINYQNIAVFKPKDEEPFAPQNPKWPKYFQRMLCFCCFGRACLIPNNGYISETAASLVDEKLQVIFTLLFLNFQQSLS